MDDQTMNSVLGKFSTKLTPTVMAQFQNKSSWYIAFKIETKQDSSNNLQDHSLTQQISKPCLRPQVTTRSGTW